MQTAWTPDEYIRTYRFAANAHLGQLMPDSVLPYIVHVSLVTMEIIAALQVERGHDEDMAVKCALLHDVLEDSKITCSQIANEFGEKIVNGVSALTKDRILEKTSRVEDILGKIQKQPLEVWMVKIADRITNLQPPPSSWTKDKIQEYKREAIKIYDTLKSASPYLASRLETKIKTYGIG